MKHHKQPTPKSCGQTCLAILAGKTPREVIELLPDKKGTSAKQLYDTAKKLGVQLDMLPPLRFKNHELPLCGLVIARIIWEEKRHRTHWIVIDTSPRTPLVYDPSLGTPWNWLLYVGHLERNQGRIMSFIEVL